MIKVLFFASLRDAVGVSECELAADTPLSFEQLMSSLRTRLNERAFAAICAENVRIAVNHELVEQVRTVASGDEIAFLPPVTGG